MGKSLAVLGILELSCQGLGILELSWQGFKSTGVSVRVCCCGFIICSLMKRNFLENNNLLHNYVKLSQEYPSTHKVSLHQKSSSRLGINNIMKQIQKNPSIEILLGLIMGEGDSVFVNFPHFSVSNFPLSFFHSGSADYCVTSLETQQDST